MKYMGSKRFMVSEITDIIHTVRNLTGIKNYYELFMGGANVIENINIENRLGNDLNKYLISFIEYIRTNGVECLPESISKEIYFDVNENTDKYDNWFVFWVMNFGSFNSQWGKGYGAEIIDKYGKKYNKMIEAKNSLRTEVNKLNGFDLTNLDYKQVEIQPNSIIYLDPPYKGTVQYKGAGTEFNHKEFYDYAIELSKNNFVLISEYMMPRQFKAIKWVNKSNSMIGKNIGEIEGLFVVKDGFGVKQYLDFINNQEEIII